MKWDNGEKKLWSPVNEEFREEYDTILFVRLTRSQCVYRPAYNCICQLNELYRGKGRVI